MYFFRVLEDIEASFAGGTVSWEALLPEAVRQGYAEGMYEEFLSAAFVRYIEGFKSPQQEDKFLDRLKELCIGSKDEEVAGFYLTVVANLALAKQDNGDMPRRGELEIRFNRQANPGVYSESGPG